VIVCDADYYSRLGVGRNADEAALKKAYRKLARKYHPDVNDTDDAKERFQEITEAYEVLSDPNMRARYDQFGEAGVKGAAAGGAGASGFGDFGDFGPFSDVFESFFGGAAGGARAGRGGPRRTGPSPGEHLRVDVDLDFEKAVFGGEHKIRFSHLETCSSCKGSGAKSGSSRVTCNTCNGQGVVMQVARTPLGAFQSQTTCPTCRGEGDVVKEVCTSCGGKGRKQVSKTLKVTIPPGVDNGSKLRVRGEGDAGPRGGPAGDLYVALRAKPHASFTREGMNIFSRISVSYLDAILGADVQVPTLDGEHTLKVSAGTQPGTQMKIDGKGVPNLNNKYVRGDHYVTVDVAIPKKLSADEKKVLRELQDKSSSSKSTREGLFKGFRG